MVLIMCTIYVLRVFFNFPSNYDQLMSFFAENVIENDKEITQAIK